MNCLLSCISFFFLIFYCFFFSKLKPQCLDDTQVLVYSTSTDFVSTWSEILTLAGCNVVKKFKKTRGQFLHVIQKKKEFPLLFFFFFFFFGFLCCNFNLTFLKTDISDSALFY